MATSDPDFEQFWRDNVIAMVGKTIKSISRDSWSASKKKYQPPPVTESGVSTGQSAMGLPGKDETT